MSDKCRNVLKFYLICEYIYVCQKDMADDLRSKGAVMGWTGVYDCHDFSAKGRKDYLDNEFTWNGDKQSFKVIDSAMVGSTYYAAVESIKTDTNKKEVWGLVALTAKDKNEFLYKNMDETEGPCSYDCPKRILDKLTPTDNKYANGWRQKCYDTIEQKNNQVGFSDVSNPEAIAEAEFKKKEQEVKTQICKRRFIEQLEKELDSDVDLRMYKNDVIAEAENFLEKVKNAYITDGNVGYKDKYLMDVWAVTCPAVRGSMTDSLELAVDNALAHSGLCITEVDVDLVHKLNADITKNVMPYYHNDYFCELYEATQDIGLVDSDNEVLRSVYLEAGNGIDNNAVVAATNAPKPVLDNINGPVLAEALENANCKCEILKDMELPKDSALAEQIKARYKEVYCIGNQQKREVSQTQRAVDRAQGVARAGDTDSHSKNTQTHDERGI